MPPHSSMAVLWCLGRSDTRVRPDVVIADKTCTSRAIRTYLRR